MDLIDIQANLTETSPFLSAQMAVLNKGLYYLGCITLDGVSNSYYVVLSNNLVKLHWIFLIKEGFFLAKFRAVVQPNLEQTINNAIDGSTVP